ncbi:hypothetical protein [Sphingomonas koreensis]
MKTLPLSIATAISLASTSCSGADASDLDAANPLHCAAQLEGYAILARQQGNEKLARGFEARSQWFADRVRALPANERTPDIINAIAEKVAAAPDGGEALATACFKRQDADPEFKQLAGRN